MDYFKNPKIFGKTNLSEIASNSQFFVEIFNEIYLKNRSESNGQRDLTVNNHKFFKDFISFVNAPIKNEEENEPIDSILCVYLSKVAEVCKKETFQMIFKFITLYRDCINYFYKERVKEEGGIQYTECKNAEDAPDISNEFITEYLGLDEHSFNFQSQEVIEITQNFCQWLYDNNYTCSKLTLIPQEESSSC